MNLAVNARDAMPDGGTLTFTTENCALDEREATRLGDLAAGDYVRFSVADTGTGMTAEVQSRIFDPFFTTKDAGHGTGLGLATVHGIVGKADGHIGVSSKLGEGTVFEIRWPAVPEGESPQSDGAQPVSLAGNGETVLIAEDEAGVRKSTGRMLSRNGYRVIVASGGRAALDALRSSTRRVDLLLSDAVMPDMSGPQLVEGARALQPALRVLLMSGYGHDVMGPQTAIGDAPLLKKPFAASTLLASVREALTSAPAPSPPH